jgi:predicted nucleotidyltransferase/predicted transcriptional regulator with HTH domain
VLQSLFSSKVRVNILTYLFSHPDEPFYARELARQIDEHYNAVWGELNNLESIGLLVSEQTANVKLYRLDRDFLFYEELKRIILKTTGMGHVIRQAVDRLGALKWAFIYGSVATDEEDLHSDVDLMLVGQLDLMPLAEVIGDLEDQLGREINYLVMTPAELAQRLADGEPFINNVLSGPKVMLIGDQDALRKAAQAGPH